MKILQKYWKVKTAVFTKTMNSYTTYGILGSWLGRKSNEKAPETMSEDLINCKESPVFFLPVRPTFIIRGKPMYYFLSAPFGSIFDGPSTNKHRYLRYGNNNGQKVSVCNLIGKAMESRF